MAMADRTRKQEAPAGPTRHDVIIDGRIVYVGTNDATCTEWLRRELKAIDLGHSLYKERELRSATIREWQPWR